MGISNGFAIGWELCIVGGRKRNAGIAQLVEQLICNLKQVVLKACRSLSFCRDYTINSVLAGGFASQGLSQFLSEISRDRRKRP